MSRPSIYPKRLLTEEHDAWWYPTRYDVVYCAVYGTTTSPKGRKLVLQRFFRWEPDMHPRRNKALESIYVHALHEVLKRRDGGLAYYGCELTIYAPRMDPLKVILETRNFHTCLVSEDTGLVLASEG